MWHELNRLKSRVTSVLDSLNNKAVTREKMIEFKKALVSNKSLKSYFEEHPDEKDIIINDISKISRANDRHLFKCLEVLPQYVIPENIMALNPEQLNMCTLGTASVIPGRVNHGRSLASQRITHIVDQDDQSKVIQSLVDYPAAIERYKAGENKDDFAREDPSLIDARALEPTSGRKLWKLRHNKRIHKTLKADKQGFIGGSWSPSSLTSN